MSTLPLKRVFPKRMFISKSTSLHGARVTDVDWELVKTFIQGAAPGCLIRVAKCIDAASKVLKKSLMQRGGGGGDTFSFRPEQT